MSKAIAAALREAAYIADQPNRLGDAVTGDDPTPFVYVWHCMIDGQEYFYNLKNEERSAFLYLCSLIAEDEHG